MSKYLALDDAGKKKEEKQAITTTTGVADADKIIATNAQGTIDPAFLPDSEVVTREASEDLDARDFVNIFNDGGTMKARKADATTFGTRAFGVVDNNHLTGEQASIRSEGIVGGFTGLTAGEPVFLSATTPGGITQTPPTGSDEIWQLVGEAVSQTEIRIELGEAICRV